MQGRRRRQRRHTTLVTTAIFDLPLNWNHTDWLKVPRGQTQVTLYPWMAALQRRECMRRWLQREVRAVRWRAAGATSLLSRGLCHWVWAAPQRPSCTHQAAS
jgi:hypothetical protein